MIKPKTSESLHSPIKDISKRESEEEYPEHQQRHTITKDSRINIIRQDDSGMSDKDKISDIIPMEDNFMSQLTVDSQQLDTEYNDQFSQESHRENIIQPTTEIMSRYPSTHIDTIKDIRSTEMNEVDMDESMNDTPEKSISDQVDQYNTNMNTSFPEYDDTPRQYIIRLSDPRDSDCSS